MLGNITIYKQKQGELAELAFNNARPAGWSTGFTFNLQVGYQTDSSLKKGEIKLNIPAEYLKAGGEYAIMGVDKDGNVKVFYDTDNDPNTITVDIDCEGYAFELIYK